MSSYNTAISLFIIETPSFTIRFLCETILLLYAYLGVTIHWYNRHNYVDAE
jgi:hypothetical protein